jgi:MFS transporter, ACS family, D-galactonate transporter
MQAMAVYGALPFCATALASIATGGWADRHIRGHGDSGVIRKRLAVTGLIVCSVMLMSSATAPTTVAMISLVIGFAGIGMFTANVWAITQTMAGKHAAGSWTGWQNAVGNMGGVVAPIVTGWSVGVSGSFLSAFAASSLMLLLAALLYGLFLPRVTPLFIDDAA